MLELEFAQVQTEALKEEAGGLIREYLELPNARLARGVVVSGRRADRAPRAN